MFKLFARNRQRLVGKTTTNPRGRAAYNGAPPWGQRVKW